MKSIALLLAFLAPATLYAAQTPAAPVKPAVAKPATSAAKARTASTGTASTGTAAAHKPATATAAGAPKVPANIPAVKGILKTAFALRYQDVSIGTGALAEPNKLYKVHYTGWLAADGKKFDSSFDHRAPVLDKDGKPENGADGKPKLADAQPIQFPQGRGRVIPGWDQGFEGMKIGGKRRIFIPYQLAYGALGRPPIIPAKSDLIFDVELIDITDMPTAPPMSGMPGGMPGGAQGNRPMPGGAMGTMPARPAAPAPPAGTPAPPPAGAPAAPAAPATTPPAEKPSNPAQPN